MAYFQFDTQNNSIIFRYVKIILTILMLLLSIISFIYIYNISYIINNIHIKTINRKMDKIEGNITELFNYTEDINDYMIDNVLFELNSLKNETRKKQTELEGIINSLAIENKQLRTMTKTYLKQVALNYIKHNGDNLISMGSWFHINYDKFSGNDIYNIYKYDDQKIANLTSYAYNYYLENIDSLINIDYDNFLISFSYFSNDVKINYEKIMKIFFNEDIIFDETNIFDSSANNPGDISQKYYLYSYKFIYIIVMPPVKFI